jgi:hypothetical protein
LRYSRIFGRVITLKPQREVEGRSYFLNLHVRRENLKVETQSKKEKVETQSKKEKESRKKCLKNSSRRKLI